MRTAQEINTEYTSLCAQIGQLETRKQMMLAQFEAAIRPLIEKAANLEVEAVETTKVQSAVPIADVVELPTTKAKKKSKASANK